MAYKYLNNVLEIVHYKMKEYVKDDSLVVDCTLGNGNDTYNLLKLLGDNGSLFGFDIQKEAIEKTKEKLKNIDKKNYKLILDSHENIDKYIETEIDYIIYNLGYLPGGDKSITTKSDSSLRSIKKSLKLIKENGVINIVAYPGHESGWEEKEDIEKLLLELNQKEYHVLKHQFINQKNNPPILYEIERKTR